MIVVAALVTIGLALLLTRSIVLPLAVLARGRGGGRRRPDRGHHGDRQGRAGAPVAGAQGHAAQLARDDPAHFRLLQPTCLGFRGTQLRHRGCDPGPAPAEPGDRAGSHGSESDDRRGGGGGEQRGGHFRSVRESDRIAQHGREQVHQTVLSIESLAEDVTANASQVEQLAQKVYGISKVLEVIRAIAEQTNLLALNAAIEAARAGDAGRGFAVVADEVRALAHRTQQSTQEIEQMIGGIQQGTDQAVSSMQHSNSRARSTLEVAKVRISEHRDRPFRLIVTGHFANA
ncbi:methyl-accepting chemotaxis protein [Pseudomonas saponiphila]|uniref:methyl-accepting chemotaxis protein n=1 Tax=Pseudomonas saponiphila TaxID=556534 RepID=UPI003CC5B4C1